MSRPVLSISAVLGALYAALTAVPASADPVVNAVPSPVVVASDSAAPVPRLQIQGHQFQPAELHVKAGRKLVLEVENRDDAVEEFESYDLDREQRVQPGQVVRVLLGPLARGRYPFFGDFHRKSAQGVLVVD